MKSLKHVQQLLDCEYVSAVDDPDANILVAMQNLVHRIKAAARSVEDIAKENNDDFALYRLFHLLGDKDRERKYFVDGLRHFGDAEDLPDQFSSFLVSNGCLIEKDELVGVVEEILRQVRRP